MGVLKYRRLLLIPILGLLFYYCLFTHTQKEIVVVNGNTSVNKNYMITLERGAFHYDRFILKNDTIFYFPDTTSQHSVEKYNVASHLALDSTLVSDFFKDIEAKGFWELKNNYTTQTSCTSKLIVTIKTDKKSKTVICDDFEKNCPDVMKFIDKKIIELEGNHLKRIYLPG
ncbi:hypothetical protein [Costertonia aggregata]|uniref:Uncharacterized protein n=1 Tax=Costertonia aggregata TaxID=343403 RepID=A0A7H9AM53_9FLAO|nr:hypothetical protein [Costertonia aggregata]QLG44365.1 hypothetical protein HYG79_03060 [Costertonia aggregata]